VNAGGVNFAAFAEALLSLHAVSNFSVVNLNKCKRSIQDAAIVLNANYMNVISSVILGYAVLQIGL